MITIFDKENQNGTFQNFFKYAHLKNISGDMRMSTDL